ncbi:class Ib ribonucleoside-diphosphate reductase assembly flavoprotein NrdI [Brachybacterium alimentarium]|uniref:class Ib ribonucleoside-diphosphate reductase assembly flavoprotein NrdI n=1 Tax=Brachybacterium alimentarium TaxID=47845 RepID=UPI003FD07EDA
MKTTIKRATPRFETRVLTRQDSADLAFFFSTSANTLRFAQRLGRPATRIPLRPRQDGKIRACRPFAPVVPTYGGREQAGAVPKRIIAFLNAPTNRTLARGGMTAGNTNFGEHYCLADPVISRKCGVPDLYRFDLVGTQCDVDRVNADLDLSWKRTGGPDRVPNRHRRTA